MASASIIQGPFCAKRYKQWDTFTDNKTGESVPGGRSLTVWVVTMHDEDLCEIRFTPDSIDSALEVVDKVTFGVEVIVQCGDKSYGRYKGFTIEPAKKSSTSSAA